MLAKLLSLIFMAILSLTTILDLPLYGYNSKQLLNDPDFSNGFTVISQNVNNGQQIPLGNFVYDNSETSPAWTIAQWSSGPCLWNNRIESNNYTITDGKTKSVTYNPADKSVSMRLNATGVYNGMPASDEAWPHLLLEQSPIVDYHSLIEAEKAFYNCSADRMILSLDIRLSKFTDTTNIDGINAVQYLAYFYMNDTDGHNFIWFGVNLFDSRGYVDEYWALDKASNAMIYSVSTKDTFGAKYKSLYRNNKPYISDEWVHVELDLTPYVENAVKKANQSNTFGETVSVGDFYIGGTNIGFEIHGNYDCTVDIKNFRLTSYNKI